MTETVENKVTENKKKRTAAEPKVSVTLKRLWKAEGNGLSLKQFKYKILLLKARYSINLQLFSQLRQSRYIHRLKIAYFHTIRLHIFFMLFLVAARDAPLFIK